MENKEIDPDFERVKVSYKFHAKIGKPKWKKGYLHKQCININGYLCIFKF